MNTCSVSTEGSAGVVSLYKEKRDGYGEGEGEGGGDDDDADDNEVSQL
jgi:hypothetical protein